jgi:replicative DNA helicase
MIKFFHSTSRIPNTISLYESLIGKENEVKNYIQEFTEINSSYKQFVKVLIDDSCLIQIENLFQQTKKEDLPGVDLAFFVNDQLNKLIYDYYKKYDNGTGNISTARNILKNVEDIMAGRNTDYIPTGFKYLDKKIIGFHKKSITVLAARPGMGKTAFMIQLKRNLNAQGKKVGIISIEMDSESLWIRDLSALTKIDSMKIDAGKLETYEFEKLTTAAEDLSLEDFVIDDSSHQTVQKVVTTINKWKIQNKVDIVFLDYLTLLKSDSRDKYFRYDLEIGKMTEELRRFAKDRETPIIVLSQLNREVEKRIDKRPQLSDLRESGSIEQDARTVIFLYRPAYYGVDPFKDENKSNDYYSSERELITPEEYLELIIAKNRGGLIGRVPLRYIRNLHTFENLYTISEIA